MSLNANTLAALQKVVAAYTPSQAVEAYLTRVLRLLSKWRSILLANTLIARHGAVVLNGPFAGMLYGDTAAEGSLAPRLLGSYESELHPAIVHATTSGLAAIIDIGCAEGFYAVGFARLMPDVEVHAHDIDPRARALCADLARRNGVGDRVRVGGAFGTGDFARFSGRRTLVFIDAEGAEDDLLDPVVAPALTDMGVIVETHEHERRGVTARLQERFSPTHHIQVVRQGAKTTPLPEWFNDLGHLDQLLVVWEWRAHPTPWLVMTPKSWA